MITKGASAYHSFSKIQGEGVGDTLPVTSVTIETEQGIDLSQDASPNLSLDPSQEPLVAEVDFSTFPHLTSDNYRAKEKRATQIKLEMLACGTREALAQFQTESGYGESQIAWVVQNGLNSTEKVQLQMIQQLSQPCLDLSIVSSVSEVSLSVESVSSGVVEASAYQWDEIEQETDVCMGQLGWTLEQGQAYLQSGYGVSSRRRLSDEQVLEFWAYLKGEVARRNL